LPAASPKDNGLQARWAHRLQACVPLCVNASSRNTDILSVRQTGIPACFFPAGHNSLKVRRARRL